MVRRGASEVKAGPAPYTFEVPLHPLSAKELLDVLEHRFKPPVGTPLYVTIDIDNFRNQLRAHLERVGRGE